MTINEIITCANCRQDTAPDDGKYVVVDNKDIFYCDKCLADYDNYANERELLEEEEDES